MRTLNIDEVQAHLSRLVEEAAKGDSFIIAKAGKPVAKVTAVDAPAAGKKQRLGMLAGQIQVPDDFDQMGQDEIVALFEGR